MAIMLRENGKVYLDNKGNMYVYNRKKGNFVRVRKLLDIKKVM